jgi:hypothetical protein
MNNRLDLGWYDVGRAQAFLPALGTKCHLLTFMQGLEAAALNGRVVDKDVRTAVRRADESKTFTIVKPLYSACVHTDYLYIYVIEQ